MEDIINELATNSKNKNITDLCREINDFKRVYLPESDLLKDRIEDPRADSRNNILNRYKNSFSYCQRCKAGKIYMNNQYLILVLFEAEIATANLKRYKSPVRVQIRTELIQAGGGTLLRSINPLILF
jgi:hypothetical protein